MYSIDFKTLTLLLYIKQLCRYVNRKKIVDMYIETAVDGLWFTDVVS